MSSVWVENLKGGAAFPLEAIVLAIEVEFAGWDLLKQEDRLILRPKTQNATKAQQNARALTDDEKSAIKRLKGPLLDVVGYISSL